MSMQREKDNIGNVLVRALPPFESTQRTGTIVNRKGSDWIKC